MESHIPQLMHLSLIKRGINPCLEGDRSAATLLPNLGLIPPMGAVRYPHCFFALSVSGVSYDELKMPKDHAYRTGLSEDPEKESIEKTKEGEWKITINKTGDCFIVTYTDHWQCDCGKISTTGLPCSHIIKVFIENKIDLKICKDIISKRWILSEIEYTECQINEKK